MKKFIMLSAAVFLTVISTSCALFEKTPEIKLREFSQQDLDAAKVTAGTFAESFILALKTDDFAVWQKHIPQQSAHRITSRNFKDMRQELLDTFGTFTSGSYFGEVTNGDLRTYLWKLTFTGEKNGKKAVHEVIYFVRVFCAEGKAPAISRFGVKIL